MKLFFYLLFLFLLMGESSFAQDSAWYSVPLPNNSIFIDIISDNSGRLFVSTSDGLYSTTDNCRTFTCHFKADSTYNYLYDLVITKNNYLIGVSRGLSYYIYITSDSGNNWKKVSAPEPIYFLTSDSSGNIWASSNNGFYKSTDYGFNWEKIDSPVKELRQLYITKDNDFYTIVNFMLYKSTDGGSNWFKVYSEGSVTYMFIPDEDKIFLLDSEKGLLMSSDRGATWTKRGEIISSDDMAFDKSGITYCTNYFYGGVYKSADTARTWSFYRL